MIKARHMLRLTLLIACFACATIIQAADAPQVPPKQGQREVVELFNGRDLTGWKGHAKYW